MRLKIKPQKKPLENTIPLINIVFLLLIFFLLAGTVDRDDAKYVKPAETQVETEREQIAGALVIAADGSTTLNDQSVVLSNLTPSNGESDPLMVVADKNLSGQILAKTLAALKAQGFEEITLVTVRAAR